MLLEYKNLYWTRLMVVGGFETGEMRKWPLGPDIAEECEAVVALPSVEPDAWAPLFDPEQFTKDHGPLLVDDYRLTPLELERWAVRASRIRK